MTSKEDKKWYDKDTEELINNFYKERRMDKKPENLLSRFSKREQKYNKSPQTSADRLPHLSALPFIQEGMF